VNVVGEPKKSKLVRNIVIVGSLAALAIITSGFYVIGNRDKEKNDGAKKLNDLQNQINALKALLEEAKAKNEVSIDLDKAEVKIVMTKELLISGVKADAAYLKEKGINRTAGLASFYYINNAKYFDKDLTEQLIKDGIIPDSPAKALDEYNAVMNDIINKNIDVMYVTNASLSRAEKESKMISFDKFVINDIDKKVLADLDKKNMDIADTTTIEDTTTKFRASYDLLLGVAKTADNDTISEMTQGGSYLAKMGTGTMAITNGAYKGMPNTAYDPLQVYIQNARADMLVYIGETCGYNNVCTNDTCAVIKP
jgi:hypothetical protein